MSLDVLVDAPVVLVLTLGIKPVPILGSDVLSSQNRIGFPPLAVPVGTILLVPARLGTHLGRQLILV